METVIGCQPKDQSKVAVIDRFSVGKGPKIVGAGCVEQVTPIKRSLQCEIGGDCFQMAALCRLSLYRGGR